MSKLTKGLIAILLISCLLITAIPAFAEDEEIGGFPYKIVEFSGLEEVPFTSNGVDGLRIEEGLLCGTSTGGDPHMPYSGGLTMSADMIDYIILTFAADSTDHSFQFFFTTETIGWSEAASLRYDYSADEPDEDGYYTIVLDTSVCAEWKGTITNFRLDPFSAEGTFAFDSIIFWSTSSTVFYVDFAGLTEAPFSKSGNVGQLFVENGYLYGSSNGGDPYMNYTGEVNFDAANVDFIRFRMKNFSSSNNFQFFFTTGTIGWSEAASFKVDLTKCPKDEFGWIYVEIDTSVCAEWKGTVTGFRLDPFQAKGVFKFGAISFEAAPLVIEAEEEVAPEVVAPIAAKTGLGWGVIQYLLNWYNNYTISRWF